MPPDASNTRRQLLDAATRAFAEHGVYNASLLDITRQAGQRNRGALHYHFGSRAGVLSAVLAEHADFLAAREGELCDLAAETPDDDVGAVVEAVVRPAAELAESGWRGRCFLVILAKRMPDLPRDVLVERLALMTMFILRAVADRARAVGRPPRPRRPQLAYEAFVANLVAMAAGSVTAPDRVDPR